MSLRVNRVVSGALAVGFAPIASKSVACHDGREMQIADVSAVVPIAPSCIKLIASPGATPWINVMPGIYLLVCYRCG